MTRFARIRRERGHRLFAASGSGVPVGLAALVTLAIGGCGLGGPQPPAPTTAPSVLPPALGGQGSTAPSTGSGGAVSGGAPSSGGSTAPSATPAVQTPAQQAAAAFCEKYFQVSWTDNPPTASQGRAAQYMTKSYAARLAASTVNGGGHAWQVFVENKDTTRVEIVSVIVIPEAPNTATTKYIQAAVDIDTIGPDGDSKERLDVPTLTVVLQNGSWLVDGMHF